MITITVDEEFVLDLLISELNKWNPEDDVIDLYEKYYEEMVYGGCFSGSQEFNPRSIVDNDWVNYTQVITREEFDEYRIEDENDDNILCKHKNLYLIRV